MYLESEGEIMKFLGTAYTVNDLINLIKPYSETSLRLIGWDYNSSSVDVYYNEESKEIELS